MYYSSLAQNNNINSPDYELSYKDMDRRLQQELNTSRLNKADIVKAKTENNSTITNPLKHAEQLLNSKRDGVREKQTDNRLGGSSFAYKQNYKPVDPRNQPRPYDSIWG